MAVVYNRVHLECFLSEFVGHPPPCLYSSSFFLMAVLCTGLSRRAFGFCVVHKGCMSNCPLPSSPSSPSSPSPLVSLPLCFTISMIIGFVNGRVA